MAASVITENCAACGGICTRPFFRMYAFLQTVGAPKKKKSKAASLPICGECGQHSPSELVQRVGQFKASPSIFDSESRGGLQKRSCRMFKVIPSPTYHCVDCGAQLTRQSKHVPLIANQTMLVRYWSHPVGTGCTRFTPDGVYVPPSTEGETHANGFLPTPA